MQTLVNRITARSQESRVRFIYILTILIISSHLALGPHVDSGRDMLDKQNEDCN